MKKFEEASLEVIEFDAQDVVATSGPCTWDLTGGGTEDSCAGIESTCSGGADEYV